jgi:similar to spore coat protein
MNTILEHLTGLHTLTDEIIANDFLIAAKTGIRNYAVAITETASPELKKVLAKHLEEAVLLHSQISDYMISKGYYHPYDIKEQFRLDLANSQTALNLPG